MLMLANHMTLVIKQFLLCDYFICLSEILWDVVIYEIYSLAQHWQVGSFLSIGTAGGGENKKTRSL